MCRSYAAAIGTVMVVVVHVIIINISANAVRYFFLLGFSVSAVVLLHYVSFLAQLCLPLLPMPSQTQMHFFYI